jgi:hypothetical protein
MLQDVATLIKEYSKEVEVLKNEVKRFPLWGHALRTPKPFLEIMARYYWFHDKEIEREHGKIDADVLGSIAQRRDAVLEKLNDFYSDIVYGKLAYGTKPGAKESFDDKVLRDVKEEKDKIDEYAKAFLENWKHSFTFYSILADGAVVGPLRGNEPVILSKDLIQMVCKDTASGDPKKKKADLAKTRVILALICYYTAFHEDENRILVGAYMPLKKGAFQAWIGDGEALAKTFPKSKEGSATALGGALVVETSRDKFSKFKLTKELMKLNESGEKIEIRDDCGNGGGIKEELNAAIERALP